MARPDPVEPTVDEYGHEEHPAWALIGASRVSSMGTHGGAVLFDSDIRHVHYVVVRIAQAKRQRRLHHDHVHGVGGQQYVEVAMSEAQWASFVSSMNVGDGVPCTLERRDGKPVPGLLHESRLHQTMNEVRSKAADAIAEVQRAFDAYEAHKTKGNRDTLKYAIRNLPSNMQFAASSLTEHSENVVQKARADIEAMVVTKARQLGLEPGDLGLEPGQLMAPEGGE